MPDRFIDADAVQEYVGAQILQCQLNWMDYNAQGDAKLRDNEAAVLDKLYEFANLFFGTPIPAPGQGYQPPEATWDQIVKEREIEVIDASVADLLRRREEITGRPGSR